MSILVIRRILKEEMKEALDLVWKVFLKYEAPDYTQEGITEFKKVINDESWLSDKEFYGAYIQEKIVGVIATKDKHHIALFFVDGNYHRQGIGRKLFENIKRLNNDNYFTVNSSPYAHEIYKHLGFVDTSSKVQEYNGLKFYPMKCIF